LLPSGQANERATATDRRYSTLMIVLHWSTAIVVVVAYALSESGRHLRKDTAFLHFAFGLIVLMLTVARFGARAFGRSAPPLATVAPWLAWLGKAVHTLLYLLLIAVPLTGWYSASQMGMPAKLFTLTLPALTMPSSNGKPGAIGGLHQLGGNLILLLAGLHLAGVLWHQFIVKDGIFRRMSPY
jgi:cytochrome b561